MKSLLVSIVAVAVFSVTAVASLPFTDDFENGVGNWTQTPGSNGSLSWWGPDEWKNIVPGGAGNNENGHSAYQPANYVNNKGFQSYYNFDAQSGYVKAEVYMFEDYNPQFDTVNGAMTLTAANANGEPDFAEYLRIGVLHYSGDVHKYSFRTSTGGFVVTDVARKSGWTKLGIEADAIADGGQVRFFVDDDFVGSSVRSGADISVITLGQNFNNQENFWYDGVSVVPEPASALLLLIGLPLLRRRSR